eukprot:CAMPEP_0197026582 /NCGR_PEP_ID=MMETSP1384-20130603/6636_1 /TAXON_ID=29189 /ORGANISM="Ammonia sp." /LENGTH=445 /DNA_ID=CAMNT_0042455271 /DNA_START=210 /DNA_END=1547 /DNA_ORIENTATION=+
MFLFSIFAICMVLFGERTLFENDLLDVSFSICAKDSDYYHTCAGNGAVYRTSFSLFVFFAIHAFIVYCVLSFHYLFFMIKLFCLCAVVAVTFFIPGVFFDEGYVNFARIGSSIFLLIQIYVLIGWAYDTNDKINLKILKYSEEEVDPDRDLDEQGNKALLCLFKCFLIGGTAFFYALVIVFWVFQFEWFVYYGKNENGVVCSFEQAMLAINIVLVLLLSVLPPLLQTGSIFTTAIVAFYMSFLTYSALESSPHAECNWFADSANQSSVSFYLGMFITAAAISYTGFSVSRNQVNMSDGTSSIELVAAGNKNEDGDDEDGGAGTSNYDDAGPSRKTNSAKTDLAIGGDDGMDVNSEAYVSEKKANVTFHVCMAFAAVYMCMLYTGWGDSSATNTSKARGWTSVTVNLLCVLITCLLYGWTVIAPKACPGRFGPQEEDDDDQINMDI